MDRKRIEMVFFFILLAAISVLVFLVLLPFIQPLVLAAILAAAFFPFHKKLTGWLGNRPSLSAIIIILLTVIIILVPLFFLGLRIFDESKDLYQSIRTSDISIVTSISERINEPLQNTVPGYEFNLQEYLANGVRWLGNNFGTLVSSTATVLIDMVLVIFALFFLLRDGQKLRKSIIELSPLSDKYDRNIFETLGRTVKAVLGGAILVALIQGVLSGAGLAVFGVPNPAVWGTLAAFAALIPPFYTSVVMLPAVIYLFVTANILQAVGLLIWSIILVGLIDNFLGPYLYGKGAKMSPLWVLFSVLGGLLFFGPLGFIFGPLVLSLFFSLVDIYRQFMQEKG
ncbi:MAG: AI-2E family transporter [Candidatus Komeilibacteria bacterium]|nr:AI-2E family transporter [Candidatus Komeilibacteria bacterium]